MWYFTWILGLGLACSFAIINAMWFETRTANAAIQKPYPVRKSTKSRKK